MTLIRAAVCPVVLLLSACSGVGSSGQGAAGSSQLGGSSSAGAASSEMGGTVTMGGTAGAAGGSAGAPNAQAGAVDASAGVANENAGALNASAGAAGAGGPGMAGGGSAGTGTTADGGTGGVSTFVPSHLPVPPGNANLPRPTGAGTKLTTLHWAGFKGAVSYSFDDDNSSQIQNYTKLNALGVPFTFFLWTGKSDANNAIWATALKDGHELANHTKSHQSAGTVADINAATQFISDKFGKAPLSMAAPNGAQVYSSLAKGLFFINRGVANNLIAPNDNTDPLTLPTFIPAEGASASAFNAQVDGAATGGKWRTMCVHGFTGDAGAYQPVPVDSFIAGVTYAKAQGVWIDTITHVGAYWLGEKAFNQATTLAIGTSKTWTWKLPDKFPPGQYLRVTTDGGTLKQGANTLSWAPQGYYEISLDAGSVTLSP